MNAGCAHKVDSPLPPQQIQARHAKLAQRTTTRKTTVPLFANLAKLEHQQKTREAQHARQVAPSAPFAWEGKSFHVLLEHTEIKLVKVNANHALLADGIMKVVRPVRRIANLVILEHILRLKVRGPLRIA